MVDDQRAPDSPLARLKPEKIVEREDRDVFRLEELLQLLRITQDEPVRYGMAGPDRAFLYRLAIETGLRQRQLAALTVSSVDFDHSTISVKARYTKQKEFVILPLKKQTIALLKERCKNRLPKTKLLNVPEKTAKMLHADMEVARKAWINEVEKDIKEHQQRLKSEFLRKETHEGKRVFHSLRHCAGTFLAATGAHPKVVQAILQHSDIKLTMGYYTHTNLEQELQAIENLPDLSLPPARETQKATGTDDQTPGAYKKLTKNSDFPRQSLSPIVNQKTPKTRVAKRHRENHKSLKKATLGNKKGRLSADDTGQNSTGR